jgi:alkanesulfonate monooxygenase
VVVGRAVRPIAAATEEAAWARARRVLEAELARGAEQSRGGPGGAFDHKGSLGSLRLAQFPDQAEIHDKRLWTPLAKTPTAAGNSTALVGSYEQITEALLDYVAIGVSTLLIRGYDPRATLPTTRASSSWSVTRSPPWPASPTPTREPKGAPLSSD